jgi:hypothetical protein
MLFSRQRSQRSGRRVWIWRNGRLPSRFAGMTNDEIKKLISGIRQQLSVLAEKGDISVAMRQAMIAKMLKQLTEIEAGLK